MPTLGMFRFCCLLTMSIVYGCTDFVIETKDKTFINGRSLEFALNLETQFKTFPRGMQFLTKGPDRQKGIEWVSQYGYVGATVFDSNLTIDGMNEKGLSFGFLWLPGTQYPEVAPGTSSKALDFTKCGDWILGNFASVAEVKKALSQVVIWGHAVLPFPEIPPVHIAIHDRGGHHLVVEFIGKEMKIYDNPNTVLTNYPPFDWQLVNLQNYIGLNALNASSIQLKGVELKGVGQGTGFLGMPGDWTPPSRFVRMTTFLRFINKAQDSAEGVNLAEHLLNTMDIPKGAIAARDGAQDYTQWIVIKDLTHQKFYFRSYRDLGLKVIDLKKLDFREGSAQKSIPLEMGCNYLEVSEQLGTRSKR